MSLYIKRLEAEYFRGITNRLVIDFAQGVQPMSLVLFGGNGSGKSSIVDAIEFALQGKIGGQQKLNTRTYASALSYASPGTGEVIVVDNEGKLIVRKIKRSDDGALHANLKSQLSFGTVPFVLRRADILRFQDTPALERMRMFFMYFNVKIEDSASPDKSELDDELMEVKIQLLKLRAEFARVLDMKEDELPKQWNEVREIARKKLLSSLKTYDLVKLRHKGVNLRTRFDRTPKGKEARALIGRLEELANEQRRIKNLRAQVVNSKKVENKQQMRDEHKNTLLRINSDLTQAFLSISNSTFVSALFLKVGEISDLSLSVRVQLANGTKCEYQQVFSEANLDLISLLIFLALLKEAVRRGAPKILVLDDVLQSVDAGHRFAAMDYILREFHDFQLIVTAHDRLWFFQVVQLFKHYNHPTLVKEIVNWGYVDGPHIREGIADTKKALEVAIATYDPHLIAAKAGIVLEMLCNELSWLLPVAIQRRKDDRYTLGDLWSPIYSRLKKSSIADTAERIHKHLYARNLIGAHYHEWASMIDTRDTLELANAASALYDAVHCKDCQKTLVKHSEKRFGCKCEKLSLEL